MSHKDQFKMPGLSEDAQARLRASKVVIFGIVGTGAITAELLSEAEVGELVLVDENLKELSKLKRRLQNSARSGEHFKVKLTTYASSDNQSENLLKQSSVAIDSLENWQEKLSLSDVCMSTGTPLIHAGVAGFRFQVFAMLPSKSACLRCALPCAGIDDVPLTPPNLATIDAVLSMVAAWQSIETIKLLAGLGASQGNELIKFDCLSGEFEIVRGLDPRRDCPDCGRKPSRLV